ncbi:hypothetical protein EJ06DRAFT_552805 [Trichodelitschia bisporula]|uniref:Uncharacterized protein n=1 Tax=Trichodelitschia bisporula TaxID=703511 RepID=A0A6G1IAW3_9PEZI|nr:hypothetical protein EJ06DRAFT_552805 [Trichodelitschia bisporula]
MPIPTLKSLKGMGRRKSAGNSMDEGGPMAAASSFRVLPREEVGVKRTDTAQTSLDLQPARQSSYDEESSISNRYAKPSHTPESGSNSSAATSARSRIFDNASARFSSSSTLQSPSETFRKDRAGSPNYLTLSQDIDTDDFGDLFAGLPNRRSTAFADDSMSKPPAPAVLRTDSEPLFASPRVSYPSRPMKTSPLHSVSNGYDSPYQPGNRDSRTSQDRLMSSPPLDGGSPIDERPPPPPPHKSKGGRTNGHVESTYESRPQLRNQPSFSKSSEGLEDSDAKMVRQSVLAVRASVRGSTVFKPAQTRTEQLRGDSLFPRQSGSSGGSGNSTKTGSLSSSVSSLPSSDLPLTPQGKNGDPFDSNSNTPTPRAKPAPEAVEEEPFFDTHMINAIRAMDSEKPFLNETGGDKGKKKVLSAAEFENLKKKEAMAKKAETKADSDDEENYEDDEEDEQTKAQKRKLQAQKEARHSIWRQQMTKEIGDHSVPHRPMLGRGGMSTPNLPTIASENGTGSDDEDIPLGILQAHAFPKGSNTPDPRYSARSFIGAGTRPPSTVNGNMRSNGSRESVAGPRTSLPPFARKLPTDPYIGATDMVNPSNREAPGFNKTRQSSFGPPPGQSPVHGLHPNGLVGVIAEEEKQRAMRRGSPNTQSFVQTPQMSMPQGGMGPMGYGGGMMGGMPGMGGMGMPVMNGAQNQEQQQLMQVILQQQATLQYMMGLQMAQSMGIPMDPSAMPMPNGMAAGMANGMAGRPMSIAPSNLGFATPQQRTMSMVNLQPPVMQQQRTMSMLNPQAPSLNWAPPQTNFSSSASVHGLGLNGNYAPSVAPSERSNIGQPSRYKPVQTSRLAETNSTTTATTVQPADPAKKKGFFSAMVHSKKNSRSPLNGANHEEEDEDWSSFARKRRNHN